MMLTRNVPYTMVQLSTFELLTRTIYSNMSQAGVTTEHLADFKFMITASSALVAAFFSTIASQPGDTLLSIVNRESRVQKEEEQYGDGVVLSQTPSPKTGPLTALTATIQELGLQGLYKGTKARMLHIAVMLVIQLVVYDYIKLALGIAVTGLSR